MLLISWNTTYGPTEVFAKTNTLTLSHKWFDTKNDEWKMFSIPLKAQIT